MSGLPAILAADLDPLAIIDADETGADLPEAEQPQRWTIDGLNTAEWAMRVLAGAYQQADGIKAQADEWRAQIDAWEKKSLADPHRTIDFFEGHLARYALEVRELSGGKTKTLALPSGKVTTRTSGPKVTVVDEPALLAWIKESMGEDASALIKTTESVRLTVLREVTKIVDSPVDPDGVVVVAPTGEILPGVAVVFGGASATVVPG